MFEGFLVIFDASGGSDLLKNKSVIAFVQRMTVNLDNLPFYSYGLHNLLTEIPFSLVLRVFLKFSKLLVSVRDDCILSETVTFTKRGVLK